MPVCAQCGHEFDIGRFCTNCGHPVDAPVENLDDWRTDTAERADRAERADTAERAATAKASDTAERPAMSVLFQPPPPPAESARFPLYADEVTTPVSSHSHRAGTPWLPWVAGAVALLLVAGLGAWLLFGGDDSDPDLVASEPRSTPTKPAPKSKPAQPKNKKEKKPPAPKPAGKPTDVASLATADVPATAPPGTDVDGNLVRYDARNMLDGVPSTSWRMPGDGSGKTITVDLAKPTELTSVGLINGYAKTDTDTSGQTLDWYTGNRRILAVEWILEDGTVVTQDLTETRTLQRMEIEPATTSTVELRLLTVTPPGQGPSRRDYTAISEISVIGTPA
jgi:hypothetical protein